MLLHHKASSATTHPRNHSRWRGDELARPQHLAAYLAKDWFLARSKILPLLLVLVFCTSLLEAAEPLQDRRGPSASLASIPETNDSTQFWRGPALLVDTREEPLMPLLEDVDDGHAESTRTLAAPPSKRSVAAQSSSANFQIPQPFDSSLSNNFTSNCAGFFSRMLNGDTIKKCHPFSLLLQTSSSFFDVSKSFVRITQTLEATCAANSTQCVAGMNSLARELGTDAACRVDYNNNNPQVVQAYNGLLAYAPMYRASCLQDGEGNFCYADAVTNTTTQGADAYPYYLPLGVSLPGGTRQTCNTCLQDTMAIFSSYAGNSTQPISKTYSGAANTLSIACGRTFVNVTVAPLKGAASPTAGPSLPMITLASILLFFFLQ